MKRDERRASLFVRGLDGIISAIAPTWAYRRGEARQALRSLSLINDQGSRSLFRTRTAEGDTLAHRVDFLKTARQLMHGNAYAVGAVNSITGNVIGRGMKPESQVRMQGGANRGELNQDVNDQVEEGFKEWAKGADLTGRRSLRALQRDAYRERWVSNDVFVRHHWVRDGRKVPLGVEVVASELLSDKNDGDRIKQGIEFNKTGQIVGYHFYVSERSAKIEFVPADRVVHLYRPHRIGAIRGLSPLAPVARAFDGMRRYLDHEVRKAEISSAFVFMHKKSGSSVPFLKTQGTGAAATDTEGNPVGNLAEGGGIFITGGPNDSLESVSPAGPGSAFDPFTMVVLRQIATGLGISYELLTRDFRKASFASSRQAALEDRRQWEPEQEEFVNTVLMTVWNWFIEAATLPPVSIGVFANRRKVWPVVWTPPGWQWVDPVKESQATGLAIDMGIDNPIAAARRQGRDFYENILQKAAAEAFAKEHGTTISTGASSTNVDDENKTKETEAGAGAGHGAGAGEGDGDDSKNAPRDALEAGGWRRVSGGRIPSRP